jgi:hypothetical protein
MHSVGPTISFNFRGVVQSDSTLIVDKEVHVVVKFVFYKVVSKLHASRLTAKRRWRDTHTGT